MSRSRQARLLRADRLKVRIASGGNEHFPKCTILGCGRPTRRAAREGLSAFTCRYHQQHKQRHGSHWCKSPVASALRPYVSAALSFIRAHRADPFVTAALMGIGSIMASAGPVEIATRLRGLPPNQRANIALARLREANIKPERLLAIAMAVHALIEAKPEKCHRVREWRVVAIAKATHRLASGTHRRWAVPQPDGRVKEIRMDVYPRSSGRVLRHLGEMIEREADLVIAHYLADVLALKAARRGPALSPLAAP
jgi:hypothetical protein